MAERELTEQWILDIILEATTREEIDEAWDLVEQWQAKHPMSMTVSLAAEQLLLMDQALKLFENQGAVTTNDQQS